MTGYSLPQYFYGGISFSCHVSIFSLFQIVKEQYLKRDSCESVFKIFRYGGAKRDRTADLLRARQALSQLSYSPISEKHFYTLPTTFANSLLVKAKSYNVY